MKVVRKKREGIKIEHNKKLFWIIIVLLAVLILLIYFIAKDNKADKEGGECKINEDCVKQQTTCCSCNMGGEEKCVPKHNASEYTPKNCPEGVKLICIALYNCKIKSCRCKEGKCVAEFLK